MRIIRLFWHQRRRFALVSVVAFLAGWALNSGGSTFAAPLTALCFALALAAALILRQSRRNVVTVLALLFLIVGLASQLLPSIVVPPLLAGSVIAVAMIRIPEEWLEKLHVPGILRTSYRRRIGISTSELWERIFPAHTDRHWDPAISGIVEGRTEGKFFIVRTVRDYSGSDRTPIKVFDVEDGQTFKVRDLSFPDAADGGPVQVTQYTITPDRDGAKLTVERGIWRAHAVMAINRWLDDDLRDEIEHIAALLEDRSDGSLIGREFLGDYSAGL